MNLSAEELARQFHELYETLAPNYGYETPKSWDEIPADNNNKRLMIAVCGDILTLFNAYVAGLEQLVSDYEQFVEDGYGLATTDQELAWERRRVELQQRKNALLNEGKTDDITTAGQ